MNLNLRNEKRGTATQVGCSSIRAAFSAYLDGEMSGLEMASISSHLDSCGSCSLEFAGLREVQSSLSALGPARPPMRLQARLREAIAIERKRGSHLSFSRRMLLRWQRSAAPFAVSLGGGLAAALLVIGGLTWMFAGLGAVQANDDRMSHLVAPHYLYSKVTPQAIQTQHDDPIVVEALVDSQGSVYDFNILEGPKDANVRVRIEDNLLASIFQPATVFGVPVRGRVVLTYTGVSVHS